MRLGRTISRVYEMTPFLNFTNLVSHTKTRQYDNLFLTEFNIGDRGGIWGRATEYRIGYSNSVQNSV
jgi:hypothetical protein